MSMIFQKETNLRDMEIQTEIIQETVNKDFSPIGLDQPYWIIVGNNPVNFVDPNGLEIRLYSSDAFGVSGLNHAFVHSTETGRGKGTNGSSGITLGNGVGVLGSPYTLVPLPQGMSENDFMDKFEKADGWNNYLWIPWINDCHTDTENGFNNAGVPYLGTPNGRIDIDDDIKSSVNDASRIINQIENNPLYLYRIFGGY